MTVLYLFILAHLLADFPLQTTGIYEWKYKSIWGSFFHSGVFITLSFILLFPYRVYFSFLILFFVLWLIHGFQDWLKAVYIEKYHRDNLWIFLLDQFCHIAVIIIGVSLTPFGKHFFYLMETASFKNFLLILIGYTFISFTGVILLAYIKKEIYATKEIYLPNEQEKWKEIFERVIYFTFFLLGGFFYIVFILVSAVFYFGQRKQKGYLFNFVFNITFSFLVSQIFLYYLGVKL